MYTSMAPEQFRRRFRTERDCMRYLIKRKWPDGFCCPCCGHDKAWLIPSRRKYRCKNCNHQTSLTAHTIFHKTRKPLKDWFWAIFLVATRTTGSSARQLQYDLGISYPTAWSWFHKIRKAMEDRATRYNLRGMVELDDTYIGGKKKPGKRGRMAKGKVPVMVAVESCAKGCGHLALTKAASVISVQVKTFISNRIDNDTIMFSDGFSSYRSVSKELALYPLPAGTGQRAVVIFPDVHRVIARHKIWIRGTHSHVSGRHLDR